MKLLYEFTLNRVQKIKDSQPGKDDKGNDAIITTTIDKEVPVKLALRKPTRSMLDEGDSFFSEQVCIGRNKGLDERIIVARRLEDSGGVLSDALKNERKTLVERLEQLRVAAQELEPKEPNPAAAPDVALQKKKEELFKEAGEIVGKLQQIEQIESIPFEHTAEARARLRTLTWWLLQLALISDAKTNTYVPLFGNGDYKEKLKIYDSIEEDDDPFMTAAINKFVFYITLWYTGRATKPEEFDAAEKAIKEQEEAAKKAQEESDKADAEAKAKKTEAQTDTKPAETKEPALTEAK